MKIDRCKLKKSSSDVPSDCRQLIERLKGCNEQDLLSELKIIKNWNYGKSELYHWIDVLDLFDSILEKGVSKDRDGQWGLPCDVDDQDSEQLKDLLIHVISFTSLLIEHSFSRHLYNSMEHLTTLLSSSDMLIVLAVLNLLYVFSKRSNFISRLNSERRQALILRLNYLAESWGGKENGFGLAECCQDLPMTAFPSSATNLHFEFYSDEATAATSVSSLPGSTPSQAVTAPTASTASSSLNQPVGFAAAVASMAGKGSSGKVQATTLNTIHVDSVDQIRDKSLANIMEELVEGYAVPKNKQMLLFTHLRLAHSFSNYKKRLQCVQARLQALSIIVYCNAMSVQDNSNNILYNGFIEELVDVLELKNNKLLDIKAAALRTLTSVIHLDHSSKLTTIIDVTGASSYHGFLPSLVRSCIQALIDGDTDAFPLPFATALFSFLYHLASYENGGEALVSCGMIESLLKVIGWKGSDPEHITFVTRAVRVIDLITNLDMTAFQTHSGLTIFINRLESEVEICKVEQPYVIDVPSSSRLDQETDHRRASLTDGDGDESGAGSGASGSGKDTSNAASDEKSVPMEVDSSPKPSSALSTTAGASTSSSSTTTTTPNNSKDIQCYAQRAALLKSMLNFLKKAIQDSAFSDSIRHLMDGSLPSSLRHIISNAEYYGPSLFMLATDVVTVYVFQEPSLLSTLQESGLTDVVLQALLSKEVPATREVIASLPNVFSALCLNNRGLAAFAACKPFDKVFRVLLSNEYLPAMRRRRSSDPMGDTASNLGNSMDELMRHQPSLRADATAAIIALLHELCALGSNPNYICSKSSSKACDGTISASIEGSRQALQPGNDAGSSDEEEDEEEDATNQGAETSSIVKRSSDQQNPSTSFGSSDEKQPVPLVDFILNVMRFLDAILSNNSTDDHCKEFVKQKGLTPLLNILMLPNLPIDFPLSQACVAVASVSKSILTLAHEKNVLKEGLNHLMDVLGRLEPLHKHLEPPGGSVLLNELIDATSKSQSIGPGCDPLQSASLTPLLHAMSAAHSMIIMFVHVCRTGQADVRNLSVSHWGSELGIAVLRKLSELYTSLVWESTVLLALCSESTANASWQFGRHQLEKLTSLTKDVANAASPAPPVPSNTEDAAPAMEVDETPETLRLSVTMITSKKTSKIAAKLSPQVKQIKPLLSSASRLGRVLAELFGLLVKLCVGSPLRHRRSHHPMPNTLMAPTPAARAVAEALTKLLGRGLSWVPPPTSPIPKFRLTFYICSVGFTSPMLFDERKYPYHLMLQQFAKHGGQTAFFDTFHWALSQGGKVPLEEGIEHPDLPDGTGEFLDSWLMLLEKMINPKNVLESPHSLPKTSSSAQNHPFDPIKYLIHIHKKAFACVMFLWNKKPIKTYGERMSESVLTILCHLLKGETIIAERLAKERESADAAAAAGATGPPGSGPPGSGPGRGPAGSHRNELEEQGINMEHLQQLMDMGFGREHALDALMQTASLEQATDYLLTHPAPSRGLGGVDDEEDAMQAAISLSLGEEATVEEVEDPHKDEPLAKELMDEFTKDILPGCLRLLDTLPETVYRVCDLLIAISARNGEKWITDIFNHLISEISLNVSKLVKSTEPMIQGDKRSVFEWANQLTQMPEATKAATRIHVFSLLFEEKRNECAYLIQETDLIENLVQLLEATQNTMAILASNSSTSIATPKWLAPVILLIDLYDKAAVSSVRRAPLLYFTRRQWKWFDDRSGKWSPYIAQNNKSIDDAYKNGESFVRFTAGTRRKYTVQFSTMVQVNEDSGSWRPIMFVNDDKAMDVSEEGPSKMVINFKTINGLEVNQCSALIRAAVGFITVPVEPDTLHAVMRLCLRLTRNYEQASMFAELGGVRAILSLTQKSAFTGFNSLAALIIRHVLEEPITLKQTMEKVIRSTVHHSPASFKEMHYILRVLGPAACRDKELFADVVKTSLRVNLPPLTKREDEDTRMTGANAVQILKLLNPTKSAPASTAPSKVIRDLVCDLLNSLAIRTVITPVDENKELLTGTDAGPFPAPTASAPDPSPAGVPPDVDVDEDSENAVEFVPIDFKTLTKDEESRRNRPLLTQSSLLRLLAELARSYSVVAKIITDFTYSAGQSDLIHEECSALAFILDNLLPSSQSQGDKDCSALSRVLIAAISSCNHCPEAQSQLVTEVKAALHRSLQLIESADKHNRIQAITNVMNTMIESCPSITPPGQANIPPNVRNQSAGTLNNIVKILLRRGLVNDLARVTHSLDLSSPHMAMTVNSVLKPLETLSRIVNQPTMPVPQVKKAKTSQSQMSSHLVGLIPEAMDVGPGAVGADGSAAVNGTDPDPSVSGHDDTNTGVTTATSTSEVNAFADGSVDDNTDTALDVTFDLSRGAILEEELRSDAMVDDLSHANESHDNIVNANGAESESNDDSASEDDEDDEDEDEDEDDDDDDDNSGAEDREDEDDRDDGEDEDEDVDDDEEGSGLMDEEGMETDGGLIRMSERVDEESFLLDFDEIISPSAIREGIAGLIPGLLEADAHVTSSDNTMPSVPPAPGNVSISHPLLVRHSDMGSAYSSAPGNVTGAAASILAARHNRLPRSRFRYGAGAGGSRVDPGLAGGFGTLSHNWAHIGGAGAAAGGGAGGGGGGLSGGAGGSSRHNPPMILQRLLGNSSAQDFLQLTSPSSNPRLILAGNDFQIIATDELSELVDYPDAPYMSGSSSSTLGAIPSAMVRWTEESRVLDGDSMHDCITSLKPDIIAFLEKCRDEEIADRKEKRKKLIEEDEKKNREKNEKMAQAAAAAAATAAAVPASSTTNSSEPESKVDNESAVNSSTQQLAENLAQDVLAPVLQSSSNSAAASSSTRRIRQTARRGRGSFDLNRTARRTPQYQADNASVDENPADDSPTSPSADPVVPMEMPSSTSGESQHDNDVTEMMVQESGADEGLAEEDRTNNRLVEMFMETGTASDDALNNMFEPIHAAVQADALSSQPSTADLDSESTPNAPEPDNTVEVMHSGFRAVDPVETPAAPTSTPAEPSSAGATSTAPSGPSDPEIPEGVDPSFLAALPESIRQEVIAEQLRLQRQRTAAREQQQSHPGGHAGTTASSSADPSTSAMAAAEISPEFLAALPPSIQEEVLAEQRLQRAATTIDPDAPHQFIQTLPPLLRRQVLADMDDSQIAVLPEQLATEAQALRNELEQRQRQVQERFFTTHAGSTLSRILRSAGTLSHGSIHRMHATLFADSASGGRIGSGTRYAIQTMQGTSHWPWSMGGTRGGSGSTNMQNASSTYRPGMAKFKGRQLLDHEALSCLLILLFVDEPKLNIGRLHRVLRNLSQHPSTRQWVIQSLLTIMERTRENRELEVARTRKGSAAGQKISGHQVASWLSISLDAALGCKTNVFQIQRSTSSKKQAASTVVGHGVTIHPQAAPLVSRHVLDALISLAKSFPQQFLYEQAKEIPAAVATDGKPLPSSQSSQKDGSSSGAASTDLLSAKALNKDADFWDVLVKLDSLSTSKKGKSVVKNHNTSASSSSAPQAAESVSDSSENGSQLRAVIGLLSHPVIRRSAQLTDRLLRLLSLIALALPTHEAAALKEDPSKKDGSKTLIEDSKPLVREEQLRLAVDVLTSKSCSEEGLEDVNSLLLRLSKSCPKTRDIVLELLLAGAQTLGQTVRANIDSLYEELCSLSSKTCNKDMTSGDAASSSSSSSTTKTPGADDDADRQPGEEGALGKGVVQDRFTRQKVVITAPSNFKPSMTSKEVQLPSMATLTSKTSSQSFFLRILKVIIQLRDSIRAQDKKNCNRSNALRHLEQEVATVQAAIDNLQQEAAAVTAGRIAGIPSSSADPSAAAAEVTQPSTDPQSSHDRPSPTPHQSMEVDAASNESNSAEPPGKKEPDTVADEVSAIKEELLSDLLSLDDLWDSLSRCLLELADAPDHHAVLVLQPAVEAFFLVHASEKDPSRSSRDVRLESRENQLAHINAEIPPPASPLAIDQQDGAAGSSASASIDRKDSLLPPDTQKFLQFAETHKFVLNQILRQSTTPLVDGPFAVLVDHTRVLDFDVKRRYFRQELERLDDGVRREDLAVHVRREHVFEDSFRELYRRSPDEWKNRFYIVFEGEEGQDAGGLLREWYTIISREIFNPMYALFCISPGDRVTYMINSASHCNSNHLQYFKFVGRVIAKAIYDNKLLECYFTRSFYKHILGKFVKYQDMESEDYTFYQGLVFLLEHDIRELGYDLTFSIEIQEFGVTEVRDLKPQGRNIQVTEAMKQEYVRLVCQEKMTGAIRKQLNAFLEGFYEIIPKRLISIFNEQETELLISGLPNIDIDDLKANTEYHKYQSTSLQIQWFWRALRSFDQADRAKFLQFVTGTSKVPLQGFSFLEGMNGTQKFQIHRDDRSTDRLPSAHTCFNQLDLPAYETYDKLKTMMLLAVRECSEGFGFA